LPHHFFVTKEYINEHFDQYYKGIRVDNGGYNFHYRSGKMFYAHGHYVKINDLNVNPSIIQEQARECFANFKKIPLDSIIDFISELLIKEIPAVGNDSVFLPKLVYKVYINSNHENNTEVGYIDAQTCRVLLTEPTKNYVAATGTFFTRYSGTQQGITENTGSYHLVDLTRGAPIHTWNMRNSTNYNSKEDLTDYNNIWTTAEHGPLENDMALDVHWALQKIYDQLNSPAHGINSFDDNGWAITAHIKFGAFDVDRDAAFWEPTLNVLCFGDGAVLFRPIASLDAVAHEFGHGITDFQIGWPITGDQGSFNEGLSYIWATIMEYRIRPTTVWQIGEQITLNFQCLRNIENTNDPNALQPIANTVGTVQYNTPTNVYVRSGVFSHWFYLLVNGGSGVNGIGNSYNVYGMGMDMAENLIYQAVFNNYLDNTTTYSAIRDGMVNAAKALCPGQSSLLVNQIENAWYAVGVGAKPLQISLTGLDAVCYSGTTFTLNNLPLGCNSSWSFSSNIQSYSSGSNYIGLKALSIGTGWIQPTVLSSCGSTALPIKSLPVDIQTPGPITIQMDAPPNRFTASITGVTCATSYNWYVDGVLQASHTDVIIGSRRAPYCGNGYSVQVEAVSPLGKSAKRGKTAIEPICSGSLEVIPNPASDIVEVKVLSDNIESDIYESTNKNFSVTMTDMMGVVKISTQKTSSDFTISLSPIKDGNYILFVTDGQNVWKKVIAIKH